jgi:hypothetical protein
LDRWLAFTLDALRAAKASKLLSAAQLWERANGAASAFAAHDPRRAAALHNLALSEIIAARKSNALTTLAAAQRQWQAAQQWTSELDLPLSGRSTTFHLLLAAGNSEALLHLRREKYLNICVGAASITKSIVRYIGSKGDANNALTDLENDAEALQLAFGKCAEAQSLKSMATPRPIQIGAAEGHYLDERWHAVSENTQIEMRPLIDAAYLMAGLHPRHLVWIRNAIG